MIDAPPPTVPPPTLAEATRVWARIGATGFGGPAGQIALMHRLLVEERRWISEERFLHALDYCMLLPGPEAQQLATYVGWLLHGRIGGVVAGTLFVLPGFVVLVALSALHVAFYATPWLAGLFFGLKAVVVALVAEAVIRVGRRALRDRLAVVLAIGAFAALFLFDVAFPWVVLAAGAIGFVRARRQRPAGVADPVEPTAGPAPRQVLATIAVWGGLWAAPIALVAAVLGSAGRLFEMAVFFSKMAVITFGGAYAVLAYVAQRAVEDFAWLSPGEMLDGLALAETTPGPLILVLTYVGFLAGSRAPEAISPLIGGLAGATLVTWVTFAPSFLWIFLGAPHVERLRANRAFAGALAAITAAVVGVIADLALWFALHVVFGPVGRLEIGPIALPWPALAGFDPAAAAIAGLAGIALVRLRLGLLPVLGLGGVAGLVVGMLR